MNNRSLALLLLASSAAVFGKSPEAAYDKRHDDLFHPTPRAAMRPLSTDRPDATESPFTVDAGHLQVEVDLVRFSYDRHNSERSDTRVESFTLGGMNVKAGLRHDLDLQLIAPLYTETRVKERGIQQTRQRGFGDLTVRLKWNVWGNDGGTTAFALMPYINLPTAQDGLGSDDFEGGLIAPFAITLPRGWSMGLMAEVDVLKDGDGRRHHVEFLNSITASHAIVGDLSGFGEFVSIATAEPGGRWVGLVNLGLTYAVSDDVQLDAGVNLGVSRAADDISPFVGLSWRF